MRLAVDERHADVDHRVAGADAALHLGAHALLDRGDELPRHRAADDLVDELEARARRQRLDLDVADGVLAVPAGLLDVPAACPWPCRRTSRAAAPAAAPCRPRRRSGSSAGRAARRRAPRPCTTARAGGSRGCAPAAASGPRRRARRQRLRQLVLVGLRLGHGSRPAAAGRASPTAPSAAGRPCRRACRRSRPGSAWRPRRCRRRWPCGTVRCGLAERRGERADRSSTSWSSCPRSART